MLFRSNFTLFIEIQVGQLTKQLVEKSSNNFGENIEKNPKEECKVVVTRSGKLVAAEDEGVSVCLCLCDFTGVCMRGVCVN